MIKLGPRHRADLPFLTATHGRCWLGACSLTTNTHLGQRFAWPWGSFQLFFHLPQAWCWPGATLLCPHGAPSLLAMPMGTGSSPGSHLVVFLAVASFKRAAILADDSRCCYNSNNSRRSQAIIFNNREKENMSPEHQTNPLLNCKPRRNSGSGSTW